MSRRHLTVRAEEMNAETRRRRDDEGWGPTHFLVFSASPRLCVHPYFRISCACRVTYAANGMSKYLLTIAGLLSLYAFLTWTAIDSKSPTYDEPLHTASALAIKQFDDYRVDSEDPALFKRWLSLAEPVCELPRDDFFHSTPAKLESQWAWSTFTLFGTNGANVDSIITRARAMMLIAAVLLGMLVARFAWRLAGPMAAIVATGLFCLDPTFLAHGGIAKNDVILTLGFVATAYAMWLVGERVTVGRVMLLMVAVAFSFCVKFSGVLLAPILPATLLVRAFLPETWPTPLGKAHTRLERFVTAFAVCVLCGAFVVLCIWATYGFRYAGSPDPGFRFDLAAKTEHLFVLQIVDYMHLLPASYTFGLAYTLDSAARGAFLLGKHSTTGFLYYFPVAMAVKTPLATLAAVLIAVVLVFTRKGRAQLKKHRWVAVCLMIPAYVYFLAAIRSTLNIGVRHMLPVYPLMFIATAAVLCKHRKLLVGLAVVLAMESLTAFPNYLSYFNVAAGGSRGGLAILSDSNLDWGQDLKLLAAWQADHASTTLYLDYFGTADPSVYGIRYINTGAGYGFLTKSIYPAQPGVIAVSATHLQGVYVKESYIDFYDMLRKQTPQEVLGGSIYLYKWPLPASQTR